MRCKRCGGVVDTVTGQCLVCGMRTIPEGHVPVVRTMEELAREYLPAEEETTAVLPELFKEYEDKKTRHARNLDTGITVEKNGVKGNPAYGRDDYARLLGVESLDELSEKQQEQQNSIQNEVRSVRLQEQEEEELHPVLRKIDSIIEKPADKLLEIIHEKYPQPTRIRKSPAVERLTLLGAAFGAVIVILFLSVVILSSIAPDITGEWLIAETASGERLTVEFTNSGDVTARAYIDGEENIYQTGSYKVKKSNGSNLLTITYDDGSEKRLYYIIENDTGTFTNVESNKSDTYTRID